VAYDLTFTIVNILSLCALDKVNANVEEEVDNLRSENQHFGGL
jgi:hypothetical protein